VLHDVEFSGRLGCVWFILCLLFCIRTVPVMGITSSNRGGWVRRIIKIVFCRIVGCLERIGCASRLGRALSRGQDGVITTLTGVLLIAALYNSVVNWRLVILWHSFHLAFLGSSLKMMQRLRGVLFLLIHCLLLYLSCFREPFGDGSGRVVFEADVSKSKVIIRCVPL
jgi:hypothetical protein